MALNQVVAVLLCEDRETIVKIKGGCQRCIVFEIPAMLLAGRALRCNLVVHRFGVIHRMYVYAGQDGCTQVLCECLSLEPCFEQSPDGREDSVRQDNKTTKRRGNK